MFIYAYKQASESAKSLRQSLNIKQVKNEGSVFKGSNKKTVINWGATQVSPEIAKCTILNHPDAVKRATDKLQAFKILSEGGDVPPFTAAKEEALKWLAEGKTVVARTVVNGHGGAGIVLAENEAELPNAPLYTKYIPKSEEYRVHVFKDEAFFTQRKARKAEVPDEQVNWKVRNLEGGFIFAHQNVEVAKECQEAAVKAVKALGLDFGAVDIIWNKKQNKYYVLEVNTAPGLQGTTLERYSEQFKKEL